MVMENVIFVKASRARLTQAIRSIPGMLAGNAGNQDLVEGFKLRVGNAMLSKVKQGFEKRANLEPDETGMTWPDLSPKTKAYGRRFGPGEQTSLKRAAGLGRAHTKAPGGQTGLLSKAQLDQWRQIFARTLARLRVRGVDEGTAKRIAAGYAWNQLKAQGAKTKLGVYGSRKVQVLRDSDILFNSLSPALEETQPPSGNEGQVFDVASPGVVAVGTNVPYGSAHHRGKGVPKRSLWPDPANWTTGWWDGIVSAAQRGVLRLAALLIQRTNQ